MKLAQMTLRTNHLQKLSLFLSEIFETEIIPQDEGALLKGEQDFLLLPSSKKTLGPLVFTYIFETREEFDFFFNKVNFWLYRQGQSPLKLTEREEESRFSLKDPDGREWDFLFKNS